MRSTNTKTKTASAKRTKRTKSTRRSTGETVLDRLEREDVVPSLLADLVRECWKDAGTLDEIPEDICRAVVAELMLPARRDARDAQRRASKIAREQAYWAAAGSRNPTQQTAAGWGVDERTVRAAAAGRTSRTTTAARNALVERMLAVQPAIYPKARAVKPRRGDKSR